MHGGPEGGGGGGGWPAALTARAAIGQERQPYG